MKITNNEIVVELPEKRDCSRHYNQSPNICDCGAKGSNQAIDETNKLNTPIVVDVEALATLIISSGYSYHGNSESLARHLASNLDKWMVEKKEDLKP